MNEHCLTPKSIINITLRRTVLIAFFSLLLFQTDVFAQSYAYQDAWQKIEKQELDGELKSTLPLVDEIYLQAKKDKQVQQKIRALLYQSKIAMITEDDKKQEAALLARFKSEIKMAQPVEKAILQSLLAGFLNEHYQTNRYMIGQRAAGDIAKEEDDFLTWNNDSFVKELSALYDASLGQAGVLQKEPVDRWIFILDTAAQQRDLRPTLYDLMVHRALSLYSSSNGMGVLSEKGDSLIQTLIDQHRLDGNENAYLYNSSLKLNREKIRSNNSNSASDKIMQFDYLGELKKLAKVYPQAWYTSEVLSQLARAYQQALPSKIFRGSAVYSGQSLRNNERRKVLQDSILLLGEMISKTYHNSRANQEMQEIVREIKSPVIALEMNQVNIPGQVIPVFLSHKNADKIYLKVLLKKRSILNFGEGNVIENYSVKSQQAIDSILSTYAVIQSSAVDLKQFEDYESHSTYIKIDPLKSGEYIVVASNNEHFNIEGDNVVVIQPHVQISRYAVVRRNNELLLTDRESGGLIKDKKISLYKQEENSQNLELLQTVISGKLGIATINEEYPYWSKEGSKQLVYQVEGDNVFIDDQFYKRPHVIASAQEDKVYTTFFTDRAIYRPGQTLYFKGIVYDSQEDNRRVIPSLKTTVELRDQNNKLIESVELTSNEFGSVSGSFILPVGKLTGRFWIRTSNKHSGNKMIQVEEYKRPTFEVQLDTLKETFRFGDEIVARGKVQAFSGAAVSQAKIQYHVNRVNYVPYYDYARSFEFSNETIASGEVEADAEGVFNVKFVAKPKKEKTEGEFRFYRYIVSITAVDINGETHGAEQVIIIGDKSKVLTIKPVSRLNIDYLDSIPLTVNNLNGQLVSAKGNIRLTKLITPKRVLFDEYLGRYSNDLVYWLQDSITFSKLFPHIPYGSEANNQEWAKGRTALDQDFNVTGPGSVLTGNRESWEEGAYLLEAYVLDGADTLWLKQNLYLHRSEKKKPVDQEFFSVSLGKPSYKVGESAEITFSSAAKDVTVLVEFEQNGKVMKQERVKLNNNAKKVLFPISDTMSDRVFVHFYMAKYNTVKASVIEIPIERGLPEFKISTNTFRDRLTPGQEEAWELKISGSSKDKVAAEVLALMYDASLDQFAKNSIFFPTVFTRSFASIPSWNTYRAYVNERSRQVVLEGLFNYIQPLRFEDFEVFGFAFTNEGYKHQQYLRRLVGNRRASGVQDNESVLMESVVVGYGSQSRQVTTGPSVVISGKAIRDVPLTNVSTLLQGKVAGLAVENPIASAEKLQAPEGKMLSEIAARKNLNETAFFYPDLRTDEEGNVKIRFTTPESLTEWRFMAFAHTADLKTANIERYVRTRKELMVVPNAPRFLRVGDELVLSSKIINLSEGVLVGSSKLMLFDAFTMKPIDSLFSNIESKKDFSVQKGNSSAVEWRLKVPSGVEAVVYRVVASAADFSDGEEAVWPILPSKELITETLSFYAKEGQQKKFTLAGLKNSDVHSADQLGLTLEITSNPLWFAIQALPYLHESTYQSSEQLFAKLYSSLVSAQLLEASPKIKAVFDDLNKKDLLQSKLEQNEELKAILLEETPWVNIARDEKDRMKRLALLFDLNNARNNRRSVLRELKSMQQNSGAFSWFAGGMENHRITTNIVAGFGKLKDLKTVNTDSVDAENHILLKDMISRAISYLDKEALKYTKTLEKKESLVTYDMIHYLYARSYFLNDYPLNDTLSNVVSLLLQKQEKSAVNKSLQAKAMLSLVYKRFNKVEQAKVLLKSLKEYSVQADEKGMYWKENVAGWNWWQSPIETQAMLIEAFEEVDHDDNSVEQMKVWLLNNKQTNHWSSTKATVAAVNAILFTGKDWIAAESDLKVKVGAKSLDMHSETSKAGYFKTTWNKEAIKPDMGTVEITKTSPGAVWGAMYWQHFQELGQVESFSTGLQLEKTLFVKKSTDKGLVLEPITESRPIKVGDLVTVRLIIRADRDLQFLHLKDMRASGFEPVNVLSGYKWKDRLGYYESTRDAATHFFIDRMAKGTYVFEYDLRANNAGEFLNGISTMQSMYAPEMKTHTEGTRVRITQ